MEKGKIIVGTSGFSFPDWVGPVYPAGIKSSELLSYYEKELKMEALEINSTYYSPIRQKTMENMVMRTAAHFKFAIKAYKGITHEFSGKSPEEKKKEVENFRFTIEPVAKSKRLIAVLLQFPYSFKPEEKNLDHLKFLRGSFEGDLVVEFRNLAWHKEEYSDFLKKNNLAYCVVDEPKLPGLLPFNPILTGEPGYMRLHGRNPLWFKSARERYNYLYSDREMAPFAKASWELSSRVNLFAVFFNNCHLGAALRNAQRFKELMADLDRTMG